MVGRLVCIEARRRIGAPRELLRRADGGGAGVLGWFADTFIFLVLQFFVPEANVTRFVLCGCAGIIYQRRNDGKGEHALDGEISF